MPNVKPLVLLAFAFALTSCMTRRFMPTPSLTIPTLLTPTPVSASIPFATSAATSILPAHMAGTDHIAFVRTVTLCNSGFPSCYPCHLFEMNSDGSNPVDLSTTTGRCDNNPSYSPDGKQIAFVHAFDIIETAISVINADGSNLREITAHHFPNIYGPPIWSKDGQHLAFWVELDQPQPFHIYTIEGKEAGRTNYLTPADWQLPGYSPDGKTFATACLRNPNGKRAWTFCLAPAPAIPIFDADPTRPGILNTELSWSPNGKQVTWSDGKQIYVSSVDGTNKTGLGEGFNPVWQP